ncbi:MAG: tRNA (pseudouridine(54)-N(1))-methyltransferase TrmY [Candidatus Methanomethylophilaceae archaeon]
MRYFVVTGHRAYSTPDFRLDDICGGAGRMDILVRCVTSAFFLSHDIRKDTEVYLILEGGGDAPKTVRFSGKEIRYLNPDERSTASLIRNALLKKVPQEGEIRSSPGVYISRMSFEDVISLLSEKGEPVYLKEDGIDVRDFTFPENPIFVLGDDKDLTEEEESFLLERSPAKICLGPRSLHANQCVVVVHNEMDRAE